MLIIKKKEKHKSKPKKVRNFILLILGLFFYSSGLILLVSKKDTIKPFVNKLIPVSTKQIIKDSLPYQLYQSKFRVNLPVNYIRGFIEKSDPIYIDIKQKDYEKLIQKRNKAIKAGVLLKYDEDYVNAIISEKGNAVKAKIRLKGDWPDHLQGNKWSFRVKVSKDKTFRKMKKFSLHAPVTRNYIWEWVYLQLLKDEGIPSLRYSFRPLIVNGNNLGIYSLEEHFDKILLESNFFKEGPIIKLNEDGYWLKKHQNLDSNTDDEYFKAITNGFKLKSINKKEDLKNSFLLANQILNAYKIGLINTSTAFDKKSLSKYLAINDLTDAHHSSEWINERFYFDTMQGKLIPIGFDGDGVNEFVLKELSIQKKDPWRSTYFNDIEFTKNYVRNLELVSDKIYLDEFFKRNLKEFKRNQSILYKSYPALNMRPDNLYKNQEVIKEYLNPPSPLNVFLQKFNKNEVELNIGNNQIFPIEIIALKIGNININVSEKYLLKGKKDNKFVDYKKLKFKLNKKEFDLFNLKKEVKLIYKLYGSKYSKISNIYQYPRLNPIKLNNFLLHKKSDLKKYPFLLVNNIKRTITFRPGISFIEEPLVIPENFKVIANKGVKIIFRNNGMIISNSPLNFKGSINNPIEISSDQNIEKNGISVINANKKSFLENIVFKNLGSNEGSNWAHSGAITFYQSPVEVSKCSFKNAHAEDSLNIIRSEFKIIDSNFISSISDAIDIDFSDGEINNVKISYSQNDGLDISGSNINASNILINESTDKAFSIGEASNFTGRNLYVNNTKIGFASKDGSNSQIINLTLNNSEIDIVGFQKKIEYSPSKIIIKDFKTDKIIPKYLLGNGSSLIIDQNEFISNANDSYIFNLLY